MAYSVLNTKKYIDVIKYRWVWLLVSAVLLLPGIIGMCYSIANTPTHTPLLVGIDYTGGRIIQYEVNEKVTTENIGELRSDLDKAGIENPVIQVLTSPNDEKNIISIKTQAEETLSNEKPMEEVTLTDKVSEVVTKKYQDAQIVQENFVGPLLGKQLFTSSLIAITLAFLGMIIYLTVRFHLEFAIIAILALFHDLIFVLGVFSLLGLFYGVHIDSLFVTAILTVLGFSVHDTIVVFDRIRENVKFYGKKATYGELVNDSVNQTLARSINTSLTTLITLCALYFFGGVTTKDFVLVMILGIAIGTYSSIFFASTLVAWWNDMQNAKKNKQVEA